MWLVVLKPKAIEIQRVFNTVGDYIKRYCKNVDITEVDFIENCCFKYLDGKWKRNDVHRLLARFSHWTVGEIRSIVDADQKHELYNVVGDIAMYMSGCIIDEELDLVPIKYYTRIDGMNKKVRIIGVQEPLHQMFDYVAVEGMRSMLEAKIGVFQCASLPGKGQSYGKKHIERWIKEKDTRYFVKGDIKQCFPSIPMKRLKALLARDIKNDTILWLVYELLDMFKMGLSIGSYLSQYIANYYLSYAYHYASEQLFKMRNTKHNGKARVRLINHVLFYMDDFLLTGSSKKDLRKAMKMLIKYICDFLGLEVKPNWKICKVCDSEPIDMMGFVLRIYKNIIRAKIFIKARRYFLKANNLLKKGLPIPLRLAHQCVSGFGWFKNTNSRKIRDKLKIDEIHKICNGIISYYAKKERGVVNANSTVPQTF